MSLAEIENAIADFGARARAGKLALEEMQGGTFTISNGGIYGSLLSTPILNAPQSGILGMHRIEERPVVRDGQIVARPMMYLALSYDHRLIDGREAVTALKIIKEAIEDLRRLDPKPGDGFALVSEDTTPLDISLKCDPAHAQFCPGAAPWVFDDVPAGDLFCGYITWAAERGMALTMHWNNDASVDQLLTLFEALNKEVPITALRWSIAHLNDATPQSLARMKALGLGWTVQDMLYFSEDATRSMPPVISAKKLGVPVGAGTDAHRIASYNPFTSLQWLLDGKTAGGTALRRVEELSSREDALRFYTLGSAWFSRDEDKRGSLEVGKLADLAVLSKDYMAVPVDQVGTIESLLTMVGGKIVYGSGTYRQLEEK
jgi:hypothetical protein